jgi:hypothetical protein
MTQISELNGIMTREQVLEKTRRYDVAQPVEVNLGEKINFDVNDDGVVVLSGANTGDPIHLGEDIFRTLTSNVGLSPAYVKKIPVDRRNDLLMPVMNYFYRERLSGNVLRFLTNEDKEAVLVIPNADFEHVRVSDVITGVEKQLGDQVAGYHKFNMSSPGVFEISVVTPNEIQVVDKDPLNEGIRITHSLMGTPATSLSAYAFRQICSNGATSEERLGSWGRRRAAEPFGVWLQKSIKNAGEAFKREMDKLRKLTTIPVNNQTRKVLEAVLTNSGISDALQKEVYAEVVDGIPNNQEPQNMYDIYNILTRVDTHSEYLNDPKNWRLRGCLDKVAAHLASKSELCPVCFNVLG